MNEELQLLKYHEQELVNALSEVDLLDFSRKMQENVVITGEQAETFASLDHDRLDRLKSLTVSMLKVRYLLYLVYEGAKTCVHAVHCSALQL